VVINSPSALSTHAAAMCSECLRLLRLRQLACEKLTKETTVLTAYAAGGHHLLFEHQAAVVEEARLLVENARSLVQIHRSYCHDSQLDPHLFASPIQTMDLVPVPE